MTFVSEDTFSMLPVGEAGMEGRRNGATHGLKCLQDKGIHSKEVLNAVEK